MNAPYFTLINELFPKAKIIIDPFHLVQLISRSMNQTRVALMNSYRTSDGEEMKKYRKLKNYWPLVLKKEKNLHSFDYTYQRLFKGMKTQRGIVDYLLDLGDTFKVTYDFYQRLLYAFDKQDYAMFNDCLKSAPKGLSSYMKTSLRTLKKYQIYVENTFSYPFTNGPSETSHNKILVNISKSFKRNLISLFTPIFPVFVSAFLKYLVKIPKRFILVSVRSPYVRPSILVYVLSQSFINLLTEVGE
uniref:Transposase n=1 Tax=Vibrio coralliilyticus TaxID=190893 RepID=M1FXE0_9VIBR|nr:transposase [Vibrio coralliilyticus]AFV27419.1 transposase [Vibrio coralliilyticus]